jgi:hypothetical protein
VLVLHQRCKLALVGCHSLMSLMPPAGTLQLLSACTTDDSCSTVCYDAALCNLHVHGEHVVTVYIAHGILSYNAMVAPSVEPCQFPGRLAVLLGQVTGLTEAAGFDRFLRLQLPLSLLRAAASGQFHGASPLLTMVSCSAPECTKPPELEAAVVQTMKMILCVLVLNKLACS